MLTEKAIKFMDVGVSGGIWGLEVGYCMMMGGEREDFEHLEPIFKTLAPENGYLYCGPTGAGHFVKMVHNGIEYGMMHLMLSFWIILRLLISGIRVVLFGPGSWNCWKQPLAKMKG
jgi:6-phosphogluconate dehydrogenase